MDQESSELRNTAKMNKRHIKGKSLIVNINGDSYALQVSGVGMKSVKLSLFLPYEDIIKYKNHRRLENMVHKKIVSLYPSKKGGSIWRVSE